MLSLRYIYVFGNLFNNLFNSSLFSIKHDLCRARRRQLKTGVSIRIEYIWFYINMFSILRNIVVDLNLTFDVAKIPLFYTVPNAFPCWSGIRVELGQISTTTTNLFLIKQNLKPFFVVIVISYGDGNFFFLFWALKFNGENIYSYIDIHRS